MEFLKELRPITALSHIWTRYPFNYDNRENKVSWSYQKCSDIYHKLYKEQKSELYIEMQTTILEHFFASLDTSTHFRYERSSDHLYVDSYICKLYQTEKVVASDKVPYTARTTSRSAPIIPIYKKGVFRNRSDICTAMDHLVCINFIHTTKLGPPRYKICWNWKKISEKKETSLKEKAMDLVDLIHTHRETGHWNICKGSDDSLCIIEQY